jgi:hypothetical protein
MDLLLVLLVAGRGNQQVSISNDTGQSRVSRLAARLWSDAGGPAPGYRAPLSVGSIADMRRRRLHDGGAFIPFYRVEPACPPILGGQHDPYEGNRQDLPERPGRVARHAAAAGQAERNRLPPVACR